MSDSDVLTIPELAALLRVGNNAACTLPTKDGGQ